MNMLTKIDQLLTIREVAAALSIAPRTVKDHVQSGRFPRPLKIRGSSRWLTNDLNIYRDLLEKEKQEKALASIAYQARLAEYNAKRLEVIQLARERRKLLCVLLCRDKPFHYLLKEERLNPANYSKHKGSTVFRSVLTGRYER